MEKETWFDRFVIEKIIRSTNQSIIYLATDKKKSELVVFKLSNTALRKDDILNEINVLKAVEPHPNIIHLYDSGIIKGMGMAWQSLEYCSGGDVFDYIEKNSILQDEEKIKIIFKQMVNGVSFLHKQGYLHMDVSFENFLFDEKGNVKLCDFGMSLQYIDNLRCPRTLGKPGYMAPEVVMGGEISFKTDVFSLGAVLYSLITGFAPYQSPSINDKYYSLINKGNLIEVIIQQKAKISIPAKHLLMNMICPISSRYTCKEVLEHPWFNIESKIEN